MYTSTYLYTFISNNFQNGSQKRVKEFSNYEKKIIEIATALSSADWFSPHQEMGDLCLKRCFSPFCQQIVLMPRIHLHQRILFLRLGYSGGVFVFNGVVRHVICFRQFVANHGNFVKNFLSICVQEGIMISFKNLSALFYLYVQNSSIRNSFPISSEVC